VYNPYRKRVIFSNLLLHLLWQLLFQSLYQYVTNPLLQFLYRTVTFLYPHLHRNWPQVSTTERDNSVRCRTQYLSTLDHINFECQHKSRQQTSSPHSPTFYTHNPLYVRFSDPSFLVFSLSLYRHPSVCIFLTLVLPVIMVRTGLFIFRCRTTFVSQKSWHEWIFFETSGLKWQTQDVD
jgi:hypothetical protein